LGLFDTPDLARQRGRLIVQTRIGPRYVKPLYTAGQVALHKSVDGDGSLTITHVSTGLAVVFLTPLVSRKMAETLADMLSIVPFDDLMFHGKMPREAALQVREIISDWERTIGIIAGYHGWLKDGQSD
jgi:hypothetical protein